MKKVLIITYYWPPAGGAGVQRWLYFVKHLRKFGWEPLVLTVDPQYATYPVTDTSLQKEVAPETRVIRTKSFEPLKVYGWIFGRKKIPYGGFSNKSGASGISKAIRGNLFVPDARRGWNYFARKRAFQLIDNENINAVVTTGPPHSSHLIGMFLKKRTGVSWLADFRDPWSEIYYNKELKRTTLAKNYDLKLETRILEYSDRCIAASKGFAKLLNNKIQRHYDVVTNGFETDNMNFDHRKKDETFTICYTGSMAESYFPEGLFSVISDLNAMQFPVKLKIAGSISNPISKMINEIGINDQVDYLGYIKHDKINSELINSDLLLLIIPMVDNSDGIIPGKLFEYLSTHIPIIALSEEDGDACRILRETNTGKCFKRQDKQGIHDFIKDVWMNKGPIPNTRAIENYSREALTKRVAQILEKATTGHK